MLQRNVSGGPLIIPEIPASVPPNGEIDHEEPLAGFEPVDQVDAGDPPDQTGGDDPAGPKTKPKPKSQPRAGSGSDAEEATK